MQRARGIGRGITKGSDGRHQTSGSSSAFERPAVDVGIGVAVALVSAFVMGLMATVFSGTAWLALPGAVLGAALGFFVIARGELRYRRRAVFAWSRVLEAADIVNPSE